MTEEIKVSEKVHIAVLYPMQKEDFEKVDIWRSCGPLKFLKKGRRPQKDPKDPDLELSPVWPIVDPPKPVRLRP